MKKYITTDKSNLFKEGVVFRESDLRYGTAFFTEDERIRIDHHVKDEMINSGELKELQEPIWNDDDMINFRYFEPTRNGEGYTAWNYLEQFKKEKGK